MGVEAFINNRVNCALYIGKNAGKRIENNILRAKKSVKILSPYISPGLIDLLLLKQEEGVDIKLISSGQPRSSLLLKKLVFQQRIVDENAKVKRKNLHSINLYLIYLFITYVVILVILSFAKVSMKWYVYTIPPTVLFIAADILKSKIDKIKIYDYNYSTPFFIKFINDPELYFHSKIYIIDDSKAFIGSLNFTHRGFFKNFETCITINDKNIINELSEYFNYIAYCPCRQLDLAKYGPDLYKEPIN